MFSSLLKFLSGLNEPCPRNPSGLGQAGLLSVLALAASDDISVRQLHLSVFTEVFQVSDIAERLFAEESDLLIVCHIVAFGHRKQPLWLTNQAKT